MEEVMTIDEPDFTLSETMNTEIPASGNFENITTDSCDVTCGSSSNASNVLPSSITSTCNSNAIYIVLGEITPLLQRYDCGKTILKRLLKEKLNDSINFKDMLTCNAHCSNNYKKLRSEFEHWERSFLVDSTYTLPVHKI